MASRYFPVFRRCCSLLFSVFYFEDGFHYFEDVVHYFSMIFHYFQDVFNYFSLIVQCVYMFSSFLTLTFQCFKDVFHYFSLYCWVDFMHILHICSIHGRHGTVENSIFWSFGVFRTTKTGLECRPGFV